jgi:hypothetical protein
MSRTSEVLKNKNKVEKARRARRKNEINSLRSISAFKAKLYDELKHIEVILQDENIESVIIYVPDRYMAQFSNAIYSEDLASYEVIQDTESSKEGTNRFFIQKRYVAF